MTDYRMSPEYQRGVMDFVSREVYYCASGLISHLQETDPDDEELIKISYKEDWKQACIDSGWIYTEVTGKGSGYDVLINTSNKQIYNPAGDSVTEYNDNDHLIAIIEDDSDYVIGEIEDHDWFSLGNACGYDPYTNEAYEHWLISGWLAEKLDEKGEMVSYDIYRLVIWGRTGSGQAIAMDAVIQEIYDELHDIAA